MGIVVIACYKPKAGKLPELKELMKSHLGILRNENLVTDRQSVICEAEDGTIVEVFEWKSREHIDRAHSNPNVQKMWADYAEVCDYVPIADVKESRELFSPFRPLN